MSVYERVLAAGKQQDEAYKKGWEDAWIAHAMSQTELEVWLRKDVHRSVRIWAHKFEEQPAVVRCTLYAPKLDGSVFTCMQTDTSLAAAVIGALHHFGDAERKGETT